MSATRPAFFALAALGALALAAAPSAAGEKQHPIAAKVKEGLKDTTKPFTMIVTLKAKEGTREKFEAAFAPAIKATLKEKGCLAYDLNRDTKNPNEYLLYERWQDLPSLEAHLKSQHIATLLGALGDLLDGPPELRVLLPAAN